MTTNRAVRTVACVLLSGLALLGDRLSATELPRYKLEPGLELAYRMVSGPSESTDGDGNKTVSRSITDWTITVVGRNHDGSNRLVFRERNIYRRSGGGEDDSIERWTNGFFDLQADGRLIERNALDSMSLPIEIFPRLPADTESLRGTWHDELGFEETRRTYKVAESGSGNDVTFQEDLRTVHCLADQKSIKRDYVFDLKDRLVRKSTTTSTWTAQQGRDPVASSTAIDLVSTRRLGRAELEYLAEDISKYVLAYVKSEELVDRADAELDRAAELLDAGLAALRELRGQLKVSAVEAMLEQKLEELDQQCRSTLGYIERSAKLIGRTSPSWQTTDLDGRPFSLDDYRDKVVVLDFWYRGCGWCMCAIPEIKKLVEDFRGAPVAVVGINHNRDIADARRVIDNLKVAYPTLKDGEDDDAISKKYDVRGWPTIIVIDSQGVIRHIHAGYGPNMRRQLGDKIRQLLAENTPRTIPASAR